MENPKTSRKALISCVALNSLLFGPPAICQGASVAETAKNSIVYIFYDAIDPNTGAKITEQGTGFVVSARGYVLTASHLFREWRKQSDVDKANNPIKATLRDKPGFVTESPLVLNRINIGDPDAEDVALLRLPDSAKGYAAAPICFSKADAAKQDDQLMAYGFPHDQSLQGVQATLGTQNAPGGRWAAASSFAAGMSGGPVYIEGTVIGLVKGGLDINAVNWITPIRFATNFLNIAGFVEQCERSDLQKGQKIKDCVPEQSASIENQTRKIELLCDGKEGNVGRWPLPEGQVFAGLVNVRCVPDACEWGEIGFVDYDNPTRGDFSKITVSRLCANSNEQSKQLTVLLDANVEVAPEKQKIRNECNRDAQSP